MFRTQSTRPRSHGAANDDDADAGVVEPRANASYRPSPEMKTHVDAFVAETMQRRRKVGIAAAERYLMREALEGRMHCKLPPARAFAGWAKHSLLLGDR